MQKLIHAETIDELVDIAKHHLSDIAYDAEFADNLDHALEKFKPDERLAFYKAIELDMVQLYS